MTISVARNFLTSDEFKSLDSVQELVDSNALTGTIYLKSYYDNWQNTLAGPKGGHFVHRTGATATAPTVGSPVAPGTIGTGAQAGYYWSQDGFEWVLSSSQPLLVEMFGAQGDGIADDSNALINAFSGGREVGLTPGKTYRITKEIPLGSNLVIQGHNAKIIYSNMPTGVGLGFYGLFADQVSNVKILDLEIDGNKLSYDPTDAWGIYFRTCNNVEVAGCHIHDVFRIGIAVGHVTTGQTTNAWFHDNRIYNVGDNREVTQYGNGIAVLHAQYVMIESNQINNIYGTGGINLEGDTYSDITIRGNQVTGGTGSNLRGIMQFESGAEVHDNIIVTDNIVDGLPAAGIVFSGDGRRIIANNIVNNCGEEGIKNFSCANSDITIVNNQVTNCGSVGTPCIGVASSRILSITGNKVSECPVGSTTGILATNSSGGTATITDNTVTDCRQGAFELACTNFTFTGNKAHNIGLDAVSTYYFLKNRVGFVNSGGIVDDNVLTFNAGTPAGFWFINGGNWVNVEHGISRRPSTIAKFVISSASNSSVRNIEIGSPPDVSGIYGNTAAWDLGDTLVDASPSAGGHVGWICVTAGTPGAWKTYGAITP